MLPDRRLRRGNPLLPVPLKRLAKKRRLECLPGRLREDALLLQCNNTLKLLQIQIAGQYSWPVFIQPQNSDQQFQSVMQELLKHS